MATIIDAAGARPLRLLQKDNTRPHREIADKVGLSIAAVARRIQRLREEKFISTDVSINSRRCRAVVTLRSQ